MKAYLFNVMRNMWQLCDRNKNQKHNQNTYNRPPYFRRHDYCSPAPPLTAVIKQGSIPSQVGSEFGGIRQGYHFPVRSTSSCIAKHTSLSSSKLQSPLVISLRNCPVSDSLRIPIASIASFQFFCEIAGDKTQMQKQESIFTFQCFPNRNPAQVRLNCQPRPQNSESDHLHAG